MAEELLETRPDERIENQLAAKPGARWPRWGWVALVVAVAAGTLLALKVVTDVAGPRAGDLSGGGAVPLPGATRGGGITPGTPAPDLALQTLDGQMVSLPDYRGQVVLVNFWATWCPPCRQEMPDMQQVYEERKDQGFAVLAVNVQEAREPIAGFVGRYGLTFPMLMDTTGEAVQRYGVYALPSSYFVDRDGRVAVVQSGVLSKTAINTKLEGLLK